jgi:Rps23 Pro-64 3,4-dihydroxylase Tpa1-like proline 4-hydroxylase
MGLFTPTQSSPRKLDMNVLYDRTILGRLQQLGESLASPYQAAEPFPHVVIDDFLPEALLLEALDAFPQPRELPHWEYDDHRQVKLQYSAVESLPPPLRDLLYFLNCPSVLQFLERLTGIAGLIPDVYLTGSGLHQIEAGGKLNIHADFNQLAWLKLDRRLNLMLYLNRDWKEEYEGHLELWDRSMTRCVKKILPIFNRCVIFTTTDNSYHGHPTPLACPRGMTRKSVALCYYTNGRPEAERSDPHSTLWQDRPREVPRRRTDYRRALRRLLPPIVFEGYRYLRRGFVR